MAAGVITHGITGLIIMDMALIGTVIGMAIGMAIIGVTTTGIIITMVGILPLIIIITLIMNLAPREADTTALIPSVRQVAQIPPAL